ncbi:MAG: glycosyltransferase family 2 protein [Candidatus Magasanikbacteria bacterium]|nr:glycosyltransferase family 2 protein [Candidatus Magasanikbacteria bacterium]
MIQKKETTPWVSIVIPVYNHAETLYSCLMSVRKQVYQHIEVIIVDDGSDIPISSDKQKIQSLGFISVEEKGQEENAQCFTMRIVRQKNAGAPAARNAGFSYAKGEYILFLDADIICRPDMVQKMVETLEEDASASIAYSNFYFGKKKMPAQMFDTHTLKKRNYISTMSLIRHKDFPGFDTTLSRFQDWDLWLTMAEKEKRGVWIDAYLFQAIPHAFGISTWLPRWAYDKPWKYIPGVRNKVRRFERAKKIIENKHHL